MFAACAAFLLASVPAFTQLYEYTDDISGNYTSVAGNMNATPLQRVYGCTENTGCDEGFNSGQFSTSGTYAKHRSAIQFTLIPEAGYQLNISNCYFECGRNNKGPRMLRFAYSLDGGNTWFDNGTDNMLPPSPSCGDLYPEHWNVDDFTVVDSVIFRIYAYNASNMLGTLQLENIIINGTVTEIYQTGAGQVSVDSIGHRMAEPSSGCSLTLFPNPSQGAFNLSALGVPGNDSHTANISVYNTLGSIVYESMAGIADGNISEQIDLGNISGGLYFIRIVSGSWSCVREIDIKQ